MKAVLREIASRRAIYLPLFIGLAFSATQSIGIQPWIAPFMIRTYGWNEARIGRWLGPIYLVSSLAGVAFGTRFRRMARQEIQGRPRARVDDSVRRRGAVRDHRSADAVR